MAAVRYSHLMPRDLAQLAPAIAPLKAFRTKVKPFSPQYLAVLEVMRAINALAEATPGAPLPFPPSGPPTAYAQAAD